MAYTRMEQETSIVWDEDEKVARIYTASPVSMRMSFIKSPPEYTKILS